MADQCSNCPGGSNLVHRTNPNPDIEVIVTEGNVVLHPQRLNPARVPFDTLFGILGIDAAGLFNGCDYVLRWTDTRVYDADGNVTDGECGFEVTQPADCFEFEWDPAQSMEPVVSGDEKPGAYAVNSATGEATHIFCNGRWLPMGCSCDVVEGGGPQNEVVCYPDLSGQTYSAGCGHWFVFGVDQMSSFTCGDTRETACPALLETSTDYGDFGGSGPGAGWGSLNWSTNVNVDGTVDDACDTIIRSESNGDPRREFRVDFGLAGGSGCPLVLSFDMTEGSGTASFALWDSISNTTLPATIIAAPGSTSVIAGPTGDIVRETSGATGSFTVSFACPAGVDPTNVRAVFFNWGGTGGEAAENITLEYTQSADDGCFSWPNINSLASWLNAQDPNGAGWTIIDGQVCKTVGPGQAAAYGELCGCDTCATPTVELSDGTVTTTPVDDPCVVEWCVVDANGDEITVTVTKTASGDVTTYAPNPPVMPISDVC